MKEEIKGSRGPVTPIGNRRCGGVRALWTTVYSVFVYSGTMMDYSLQWHNDVHNDVQ
eukprot:SAG11_NODE_3022_length_2757_cov_1.220843_3_plen_57_part_00